MHVIGTPKSQSLRDLGDQSCMFKKIHPNLPAGVTADNDSACGVVGVDLIGNDGGGHGELNGGGVDDTDDVAGSGSLDDGEERAVEAVLGVKLDDLLVVVGTLEELNSGVEGTAVGLEHDLDGLDGGVEGVGAEGSSLDGHGGGGDVGGRAVDVVGGDLGGEGELDLADVADGNGVGAAGGLNDGGEGAEGSVLDVHPHLAGGVVGSLPELDVGIEGTALGGQSDLEALESGGGEGPGLEGATLDEDGVGRVASLALGSGKGASVGIEADAGTGAGVEGTTNSLKS